LKQDRPKYVIIAVVGALLFVPGMYYMLSSASTDTAAAQLAFFFGMLLLVFGLGLLAATMMRPSNAGAPRSSPQASFMAPSR
jgi:hypothetical protein